MNVDSPNNIDNKFCTDQQNPGNKLKKCGAGDHWPENRIKKICNIFLV